MLAYSHIAHDCVVGNHLVMSAQSALAGHVIVEDHVNIGWGTGVHQFCRIGAHAMLGAMSKIVQDVPPFVIADGNPADRALDQQGRPRAQRLHRRAARGGEAGFPACSIAPAYNRTQAFEKMREHALSGTPEFQHFLTFADEERARRHREQVRVRGSVAGCDSGHAGRLPSTVR